jgi:hypothetical protein
MELDISLAAAVQQGLVVRADVSARALLNSYSIHRTAWNTLGQEPIPVIRAMAEPVWPHESIVDILNTHIIMRASGSTESWLGLARAEEQRKKVWWWIDEWDFETTRRRTYKYWNKHPHYVSNVFTYISAIVLYGLTLDIAWCSSALSTLMIIA